jgi:hypothetical protein
MHHPALRAPIRQRLRALLALGVLPIGVAACGSDDDADAADDLRAYCADVIVLDQMFQNLDAEDPPAFEAALAAATPVVDRIVAAAPDELEDEYTVIETAFDDVVESGSPEAYFTPQVTAANDAVHTHDVANCGWTVAEIAMEDFHYGGTFPSGPGAVSFDVTNTGAEAHALIVARKLDAVEGSALDAFNGLESDEAFPTAFEPAASVFAEPGDSAHGLAELEPGEYIVFCPIPTGTAGEESVGDGPPHFVDGMITSFVVASA